MRHNIPRGRVKCKTAAYLQKTRTRAEHATGLRAGPCGGENRRNHNDKRVIKHASTTIDQSHNFAFKPPSCTSDEKVKCKPRLSRPVCEGDFPGVDGDNLMMKGYTNSTLGLAQRLIAFERV